MRNTFLLYIDRLEVLDEMTDEDAGRLFRAIRDYVKNGSLPERGTVVSIAFHALKPSLDSDAEKYRLMCLQRSEAGKKSGQARAKKKEEERERTPVHSVEREGTTVNFVERKATKRTDTDTNTDTDNTPPVVGVLSAGARVDVGDDGVKLPVSPTDTVPLDEYFVAQLREMYPEIDIAAELRSIALKMIASNYPCRNQTSMQKYVLEWMKRVEIVREETESKRLSGYEAEELNERIAHINAEDI